MLECEVCDKVFTHRYHEANKNNLREHLEAHYRRGEGTHNGVEIECKICEKTFYDPHGNYKHVENMRKQHMKVHDARNIPCPIAQDKFFKSPADAVKHVESGTCEMCRGKEKARMAIFDFLKSKKVAQNLMNPQLEYDGGSGRGGVPEYPYKCNQCQREFKNMSSLMQHQHDSTRCDDVSSRLGRMALR